MDITVISRETIKPSSPTPHHLHHPQLSLIDQISPTTFIRILFFYSSHGDPHRYQTTHTSDRLKKSLSAVLTEFYPVAGSLNGNHSIRCDDSGLEYIEARVKSPSTLGQLLACPTPRELARLVPYEEYNGTRFERLLAVQVTVFEECGGMAIGVSMSHLVADGSSLALFVARWAAIARGDPDNKYRPLGFGCASFFSAVDRIPEQQVSKDDNVEAAVVSVGPKFATRRFVFPQMKIDTLKAICAYESPTRVEAVSALILKCLVSAIKSSCSKPIVLCMGINLRSRLNPPLPAHYFGNIAFPGRLERIGSELSLNELGMQVRGIIKEIDGEYLDKLQADGGVLLIERSEQQMKQFMDNDTKVVMTTSWCRFPWYDVDVGWGSPTLVAPVFLSSHHSFILLDAKNGDGIDAWVTLEEDDMVRFEADDKLVDFACPNPNPNPMVSVHE